MRYTMWLATGLMGLTTAIHLFGGTPEILDPVLAADLDPIVQSTSFVVWHGITALLALMTVALGYLAARRCDPLFYAVLAVQLSFAALFFATTLLMHGAVFALPQWTIFFGLAVLMLVAHRGMPRNVVRR